MTPGTLWATLTAAAMLAVVIGEWRGRGSIADSLVALVCGDQMLRFSGAPW